MHIVTKTLLGACAITMAAAVAQAQDAPMATISDPSGPVPDAGHITFTPPAKVVWTGSPTGQQQARLFGDPDKPGLYGILIKWNPGAFSKPHFHDHDRYIYVVSGTWWVSASNHYDPKNTYPMPAGSVVQDIVKTVHYDGARAGGPPAIIELVGMGPVKTIPVDEQGKPKPTKGE